MSDRRLPALELADTRSQLAGVPDPFEALERATNALRLSAPERSAGLPTWRWQKLAGAMAACALLAGTPAAPRETIGILFALLIPPFFCVVVLRALALWNLSSDAPKSTKPDRSADSDLPSYSVIVPLYREVNVVPDLVEALSAIDYPPSLLEVLLVTESDDAETTAAVQSASVTSNMRLIVVPGGAPRTKPRALNYALSFASGAYVVVYDAEDVPEPDQLRCAVAVFARGGERLGCVQAKLNVYNSRDSWLTRQFTIEYTALFDCLLPTLQKLELPVPLGGTSNHFPRVVLESACGWDPFNVTEDADLGVRLARDGWQVQVLPSTTWEEAPAKLAMWVRQRTRWLKGWMQTYLVHMRQPGRLHADLGTRRFIGFQVLMGGLILSALVHPWFYVLVALDASHHTLFDEPDSVIGRALWWIGAFNFVTGCAMGAALGAMAALKRGRRDLAIYVATMPVYWLLISFAAYRAMWQLTIAPYVWEKTEHGARRGRMETVPTVA